MTAPSRLSCDVRGMPAPKGSTRSFAHRTTGRVVTLADAKGLPAWSAAVTHAARQAMAGRSPMIGPVALALTFRLRAPKRLRNPGAARPATRPDLDKLVRGVCDALTRGGVWGDDGQVCRLQADKFYALPGHEGATVYVSSL